MKKLILFIILLASISACKKENGYSPEIGFKKLVKTNIGSADSIFAKKVIGDKIQ